MFTIQLANLLVYNLIEAHIPFVVFFHCWSSQDIENARYLHELLNENYIFTQFVDLRNVDMDQDLEYTFLQHPAPTLAVCSDMSCEDSEIFLNMSSRARLYNQHYHWLIYEAAANVSGFEQQFTNANLSVDADVTYIQEQIGDGEDTGDTDTVFVLYDVYSNGHHIGGQLNMTIDREIHCNLTECRLERYLSDLHLRSKYGNRNSLRDVTMRVATVVSKRPITLPRPELIAFLLSLNDIHVDSIARFGYQMLLILKDQLLCDFQLTFMDTWSLSDALGGIVGAVATETADLASTPFLVTEGRLKYVSAIIETGAFKQVCIFRTPRNAGIHGDVFLKPFSASVWILFFCTLFLAGLVLWCTFFLEKRSLKLDCPFAPSLLTTLLISFGTACVQSSCLIPLSTGGRMALFVLLLSSFMMYNYYTSVVVSSLLGEPVKSNIKTLAQLADSSLEVGLEPLPFTTAYLNYSKLPEVRRLVKNKIEGHDPKTLWWRADEGVRRVRDRPGFVFIFEASAGYELVERYYQPHEICDLNEVMLRPEKLIYTGLHRNSTYKEIVRLKQLRMLETGVYRKHRNHWVKAKLHCFDNNFIINVGMEYVAPLFFMLICAYGLVLILLLLEITWKRYESKLMALIAQIRSNTDPL